MEKTLEAFNWSLYENGYKGDINLKQNFKIKGQEKKVKCFSREPYAQQLFDTYLSNSTNFIKKDLSKGDCVKIVNITNISDEKIIVELLGGLSLDIDLGREKKFVQLFGYENIKAFTESIKNSQFLKDFIDCGIYAYIVDINPSIKASLWQGHIQKIKEEFMTQISNPSKAYVAKIVEANKGGFFVEVQGVDAFMPGSLAAANKIMDFKSYVGKEVIVMVEDFLTDINSFIVSHKKYIEYVLPKKLSELSLNTKYSGVVTGTSKYGIFLEFEEIFTGLLHSSKMKELTLNKFNSYSYKPGDIVDFYINEITKDNRIILTEETPEEKKIKFENFIKDSKNKILDSKIVAIMNFGVIVNVNDFSGLILNKDFKKRNYYMKNLSVGDDLKVTFLEFKDDKLIFDLYLENE